MTIHWGVDSATPSNFRNPDRDHAGLTMYDYVVDKARTPEFWGRYIGRQSSRYTGGPRRTELDEAEVRELHSRGCSILLIYHGLEADIIEHTGRPDELPGGYDAGRGKAEHAVGRARAVGAPPGVRIYADLENWSVRPDWIRGWCDYMQQHQGAGMGGFYGKTVKIRESPDLLRLGQNRRMTGVLQRGPLGTETVSETWGASFTAASNFRGPTGMSCREHELDSLMLHGSENAYRWTRYLWSNEPMQIGDPPAGQLRPPTFSPAPPRGGGDVVLWQYRERVYDNGRVSIDLNLANDRGFNDMWHPPAR